MRYLACWVFLLLALAGAARPACAQLLESPPAPLWKMEANGDAIQTNVELILPRHLQRFQRTGFTSIGSDGRSVAVHYHRADGPLKLRILIQLRSDLGGFAPPGADGIERNWRVIRLLADAEYLRRAEGDPEELADSRFVWGDAKTANARMQLRRYRLAGGNEVQGIWYRNIGVWAVMIAVSGPEHRRSDVEEAGPSVIGSVQWPGAPISAELHSVGPAFIRNLKECGRLDRTGTGQVVEAGPEISSMIGLALYGYFIEGSRVVPHPAADGTLYCRIETFKVGRHEVLALGWKGDTAGYPAVRYAFMLVGTGVLFQFESFFTAESVPPAQRGSIRRLVWLTSSGSRSVAVLRVLDDWPSYEQAKAIVISVDREGAGNLVELTHPPGKIHAIVNVRETPRPADSR